MVFLSVHTVVPYVNYLAIHWLVYAHLSVSPCVMCALAVDLRCDKSMHAHLTVHNRWANRRKRWLLYHTLPLEIRSSD